MKLLLWIVGAMLFVALIVRVMTPPPVNADPVIYCDVSHEFNEQNYGLEVAEVCDFLIHEQDETRKWQQSYFTCTNNFRIVVRATANLFQKASRIKRVCGRKCARLSL